MDGIVLFADNKVFCDGNENQLFRLFLQKKEYSVLPIDNLAGLEAVIKSASTIKACIIDWNFENTEIEDEDFEGVQHPQRTPMRLLQKYPLYTLVYIYSERPIPENEKSLLKKRFGKKIRFRTKGRDANKEYQLISKDLVRFEENNPHMEIPFIWSQTINNTTQALFKELENADSNWISEFRDTSKADGGDPTTDFIEILNNLLIESMRQSCSLKHALDCYSVVPKKTTAKNTAKVYQRLLYSKVPLDTPIMTGEIFRFDESHYGVLITPECEIKDKVDNQLDFLVLQRDGFKAHMEKNYSYIVGGNFDNQKEKRKESLRKVFNNDSLSIQILPGFPFSSRFNNEAACISFKNAFCIKKKNEYISKRMGYRLNSPYIHQLRQRFLAFFGRYGVPAIPDGLRDFNLR